MDPNFDQWVKHLFFLLFSNKFHISKLAKQYHEVEPNPFNLEKHTKLKISMPDKKAKTTYHGFSRTSNYTSQAYKSIYAIAQIVLDQCAQVENRFFSVLGTWYLSVIARKKVSHRK